MLQAKYFFRTNDGELVNLLNVKKISYQAVNVPEQELEDPDEPMIEYEVTFHLGDGVVSVAIMNPEDYYLFVNQVSWTVDSIISLTHKELANADQR